MQPVIFMNRNIATYAFGVMTSSLGDAMFMLALSWLVVNRTGSGILLGTMLGSMAIAQVSLSILGGAVVDRCSPKSIMIASDAFRAAVMLLLLLVDGSGGPPIWSLFTMAVTFGIADALFWPAQSKFMQAFVPQADYTRTAGVLMAASQLAAILGPVVGGILLTAEPIRLILGINMLSFCVSFGCLLSIKTAGSREEDGDVFEPASFWSDMTTGIQFVWRTPIILITSLSAFVVNACFQGSVIAIPFLAKSMHAGSTGFGWMNACIGVGGAIGAVIFSVIRISKPTPRMTLVACLVEGVMLLLLGITLPLWIVLAVMIVIGLMETAINAIAPSVNQSIIPRQLMGRVIGVLVVLMSGAEPFAKAVSGALVDSIGVEGVFLVCGGVQVVSMLTALSLPTVRLFGETSIQRGEAVK